MSYTRYLFYKRPLLPGPPTQPLAPGLTLAFWRPSGTRLWPRGFAPSPFLLWGLFHVLRVFATRDYAMVLIFHGSTLVHRTCLLPAHYRFPFMRPGDLQAAGIWTHPDKRGTGLGLVALQEAAWRLQNPERVLWYMVREDNQPSIRLAEKGGFHLWGQGAKVALLGIGLLGAFTITEGPNLHRTRQPGRIRQQLFRTSAGRRCQRPGPGQE